MYKLHFDKIPFVFCVKNMDNTKWRDDKHTCGTVKNLIFGNRFLSWKCPEFLKFNKKKVKIVSLIFKETWNLRNNFSKKIKKPTSFISEMLHEELWIMEMETKIQWRITHHMKMAKMRSLRMTRTLHYLWWDHKTFLVYKMCVAKKV